MHPSFKFFFVLVVCAACHQKDKAVFTLIPQSHSNIAFINAIEETDSFNILTEEYIYNGGGVGVGDFNKDGLSDLFFTGNQVSNRIYLNQGDFTFKDITKDAGIERHGIWSSGVAVIDINNDSWLDIYVCATLHEDSLKRQNLLFINQGLNKDNIPVFKEEGEAYGLNDDGYSMMAGFFDYDLDGDLDAYILTNKRLVGQPTNYRPKTIDGSSPNNDRLYRNNGDGTFTNVSKESGIVIEGFGLGLAIADFNKDAYPDLYISNDFLSNDILYINNRDGTFTNQIKDFIGHQSQFSMGNDASDINNDGETDIMTLDMLPETNSRKKTTISNKTYQTYVYNERFGYEYQYVRNMLHLNNGLGKNIGFSEIGQLSGIHQTEWSWSPLFADLDNDGYRDLLVTNGFPKDITDKDFANYRAQVGAYAGPELLKDSIPIVKIPNYAYRNNGDLTFADVTQEWGMAAPSFSNGAAYADLDNDGDLDYVVNNINDAPFIYRNELIRNDKVCDSCHYIKIKLNGSRGNAGGVGSKVFIYSNGNLQYQEYYPYRGYLSSVEPVIHFGLRTSGIVDSLIVYWPDKKAQRLYQVKADQVLTLNYGDASASPLPGSPSPDKLMFRAVHGKVNHLHEEQDFIDFNYQRTLPRKFSQAGPAVSIGDVNADGREDLVFGGAAGKGIEIHFQLLDGSFSTTALHEGKAMEDAGLLLFDADQDGDLDLYAVSGSMEFAANGQQYRHRLYKNNGKGKFALDTASIPKIVVSGLTVRAADIDNDNDLDLFVGGRVTPGNYPMIPRSYLLKNDGGKFSDITQDSPELMDPGMVSDALWSDFNNDGFVDLIVAGEFMPITIFKNTSGRFRKLNSSLNSYVGWFNSLSGGDFDRDGDIDYIAGNIGTNNAYQVNAKCPVKMVAKDFDGNGSIDPVLFCYIRESMSSSEKKLYPAHFWDELNSQSPKFRNRFSSYKQFGAASMEDLLTQEDLQNAIVMEANFFASCYIENLGNATFSVTSLPTVAQFSPVYGMLVDDLNGDGYLDVLLSGNDFGNEVFAGRMDASNGVTLLGDGTGKLKDLLAKDTGFKVDRDAKALAKIFIKSKPLIVATRNQDSTLLFGLNLQHETGPTIEPGPLDKAIEINFHDGRTERRELYYGSSYLSQSSRNVLINGAVKEAFLIDGSNQKRRVYPVTKD